MNMFNNIKKGQGLPLNAIVLAILVIIVLLVIILFFTGKMGDFGKNVDTQNAVFSDCSLGNSLIVDRGYSYVGYDLYDKDLNGCSDISKPIIGIAKDSDGRVCCGLK